MKQKVRSITEAFSMQPNSFSCCYTKHDFTGKYNEMSDHVHLEDCIVEILLEKKVIDNGDKYPQTYDVYRGYNKSGKMLFEYLSNSVNVRYYCDES